MDDYGFEFKDGLEAIQKTAQIKALPHFEWVAGFSGHSDYPKTGSHRSVVIRCNI